MGFTLDLLPTDCLEDFTHQVEDEGLERVKVVCVSNQVLDLADGAVDAAPHHVALVLLERLQQKIKTDLVFCQKLSAHF